MTIVKCYNNDNKLYKSFNSWQQACEFIHFTYDNYHRNEPLSRHRMLKFRKKIKDSIKDGRKYCGLKWEIISQEDETVKELLEDWQYYQHMEEFDKADEVEEILLKEFDINMGKNWEYWLKKYHLIKGR